MVDRRSKSQPGIGEQSPSALFIHRPPTKSPLARGSGNLALRATNLIAGKYVVDWRRPQPEGVGGIRTRGILRPANAGQNCLIVEEKQWILDSSNRRKRRETDGSDFLESALFQMPGESRFSVQIENPIVREL